MEHPAQFRSGYSAEVQLELRIGASVLPLAQVSTDRIVLRTPAAVGPCEAVVATTVDGEERLWDVAVHGSDGASDTVAITLRGTAAASAAA